MSLELLSFYVCDFDCIIVNERWLLHPLHWDYSSQECVFKILAGTFFSVTMVYLFSPETGSDAQRENRLKELIHELPDTHYSLLKYLCHFLTQVVERHAENKMNIYNLATVFGPNCFQYVVFFVCFLCYFFFYLPFSQTFSSVYIYCIFN